MSAGVQKAIAEGLLRQAAFVDGAWVHANDGATMVVTNPADGSVVGTVPLLGEVEARRAVDAAERAFADWSGRSGRDRGVLMRRLSEYLLESRDAVAAIMTLEQGKPIGQATAEVVYAASYLEWYAEQAPRIAGENLRHAHADKEILVIKEAVGVTAAITPWNFPLVSVTRKLAPALAAGCTQVLKPAPDTPLSALALAALSERAGFPKGVFNVLTGDPSAIGRVLTGDPRIRQLSFTGSTEVGKMLAGECATTVKRVTLELGGHAPFIVFEDADLEAAVDGLIACKFRNMGQVCIAASRIFVHESIFGAFAELLCARVAAMSVGPGLDETSDQGPLANAAVFEKVSRHVEDAVAGGAKVLVGGRAHARGGLFYEPTVLTDVAPSALMSCEETFGPVAPLQKFSSETQVLELANDSNYGLAAYLFTQNHDRVRRVTAGLRCGMIGVNTGLIGAADAPFGGVKASGLGREGGAAGLEEFLDTKYVCLAAPSSP